MRRLLPAILFMVGCAGGGASAPEPLRAKVDRWLASALRAHDVRTHASGEHPAARSEMDRVEAELRAGDRPRVLETVDEALVDVRDCLREVEGRRATILVTGRELTPQEQKEADQFASEAETFRLSEGFLRELRRDLE
jgi:hypothetical protein